MRFLLFSLLMLPVVTGAAPSKPAAMPGPAAKTKVPTLQVGGDVAKPRVYSLAQLQKLAPLQDIETTLKGQPYRARGLSLWSLIAAAAPRLDPKIKHFEARFVVIARGQDGYSTSFALPDLMPEVGNQAAFVVWEANGQPLSSKEGPFRLVVPGDKKPMRWVFNLVALEIYDAKRLSTTANTTAK